MYEKIDALSAGQRFTFKGFEWVALGEMEGGVLCVMANIWKRMEFSKDCKNDYRISDVRKSLRENLLPVLGEKNLLPHTVDLLSDDGIDLYETVQDKVFILSCDEYRKLRKHMPQYSDWVWTCTPWHIDPGSGSGLNVRFIYATGVLNHHCANNIFGVAPACILNPESLNLRRQAQVAEI